MFKQKPSYTIIFDLVNVIFSLNPEKIGTAEQYQLIPGMGILLHQLASQVTQVGQKRHQLYILSNANTESYANYMTHHANIFSYFDGIVISGYSGLQKPDNRAYINIIEKYDLDPKLCLFIDDKAANVHAAQAVGMHGIIFTNADNLINKLASLDIL